MLSVLNSFSDAGCLSKFQRKVFYLIYNPYAVLFVIICILLNTLFMALDHHDMSRELENVLHLGNFVSKCVAVCAFSATKTHFRVRRSLQAKWPLDRTEHGTAKSEQVERRKIHKTVSEIELIVSCPFNSISRLLVVCCRYPTAATNVARGSAVCVFRGFFPRTHLADPFDLCPLCGPSLI